MKKCSIVLALAAASFLLASGPAGAQAAGADPARLSLSFLKFNVSDLPAMEAFYMKAFGMEVQKHLENPGNTEVILTNPAGMDLALVRYNDKRAVTLGNANGPIGFYLKDVDSAYKRAMAAGAVSKSAPGGGPGVRVAIVADPEGHEIELLHLD
jgi:catechol 2,3-dioxygenase-like lactoylglutathione lyase family enzyme